MDLCHQLDDFLDRDLSPEDQQAFASHLSDCADCRAAVDESQSVYAMLSGSQTPGIHKTDEQSRAALIERIQTASEQSAANEQPIAAPSRKYAIGSRRLLTIAGTAAALLVAAFVLTFQLFLPDRERAENDPSNEEVFAADRSNAGGGDVANGSTANGSTANGSTTDSASNNDGRNNGGLNNGGSVTLANNDSADNTAARPAYVRQPKESTYKQVVLKSNEPTVTIVWLMENRPSSTEDPPEESPRP